MVLKTTEEVENLLIGNSQLAAVNKAITDRKPGTYKVKVTCKEGSRSSNVTANVTVSDKFSIAFNQNGSDSATMSTVEAVYGEELKLPAVSYEKDNYVFQGWASSPTGNVIYYDSETLPVSYVKSHYEEVKNRPGKTLNLYAVWKPNGYRAYGQVKYQDGVTEGSAVSDK